MIIVSMERRLTEKKEQEVGLLWRFPEDFGERESCLAGDIRLAFVRSGVWGLVLLLRHRLHPRISNNYHRRIDSGSLSAASLFALNFDLRGLVYRVVSVYSSVSLVGKMENVHALLCSSLRTLCSSNWLASSFFTTASDLVRANDICFKNPPQSS